MADLFSFSVHVVEPSRGQAYPLLNLLTDDQERPRVVLFPGWEDARRRRRVDYKRQALLLQRIHSNGVTPEPVEELAIGADHDDPLILRLACTAARMPQAICDLDDYLGDTLRITVQTLDPRSPIPLRVVRLYAPTSESAPRLIAIPGWRAAAERRQDAFVDDDSYELLERCEVEAVREIPVEAFRG